MTSISERDGERLPPPDLLQGASLFLDFDGTLVEIAPSPEGVEVGERLRVLLAELHLRLSGRLAILSGRSALDIEQMLAPVPLVIGGHHGLETRRPGEQGKTIERPAELDAIARQFEQLQRQFPGVLIENKPLSLALHYRQAPEAEEACRTAAEQAAQSSGLDLQPGKMVFELKPKGADKGKALRDLLSEQPFEGFRPVFLGDDLTDEPAFEVARELGGAGVLIGPTRQTNADYRLGTVEEALGWLEQACGEIR